MEVYLEKQCGNIDADNKAAHQVKRKLEVLDASGLNTITFHHISYS
jgi:hypothetical protein